MAANEFPAFIKIEHHPNRAAETSFLSEVGNLTTVASRSFAAFSTEADRHLDAAEKRFGDFTAEARRMIDRVLKTDAFGSSLNLDVAGLQRETQALQQKALAARELATATEMAAREAGDHSQTARLQIAAMQAAAKEAEQAAAAARSYASAQEQVQAVLSRTTTEIDRSLVGTGRFATANDNAAGSANAMRMGLQNLSFQINDVATMFAMGARPMQIFASQGGQVIQAVQQMSGGTSRLATFLGGPWGIALSTAAIALSPFIAKIFETEEALEDLGDAAQVAMQRVRDSLAQASATTDAATENVTKRINAMGELARAQREMAEAQQAITGLSGIPGASEAVQVYAQRRAEASRRAEQAREAIREAGRALAELRSYEVPRQLAERNRGLLSDRPERGDRTSGGRADRGGGQRVERLSDEARALQQATAESDRYIAALDREIAAVGASPAQLRQMEVARARDAAATDAQRQRIDELNAAREEAISTLARQEAIAANARAMVEFQAGTLQPLRDEIALLGLVGPARQHASLALEETGLKARLAAKGIDDVNGAWEEYARLQRELINRESVFERDRQEAELLTRELDRLTGALSGLGGAGSVLGGLLGILGGRSIGGPLGILLDTRIGTRTDDEGKLIAHTIGDELRDVFAVDGPFGDTLTKVLGGAGTGLLVGSALFGRQDTISQISSAVGGAAGQAAGEALGAAIGGTLGKAAGPIGSVLGSIGGGLLGSLLSGSDRGSAIISGGRVSGFYGDTRKYEEAAGQLGRTALDALDQIAAALGATLNSSAGRASIGIRDGSYRVDPRGRGYTKISEFPEIMDFGSDAEAAVRALMLDLINDGVIGGLTAAEQRLLRAGSDIEAALQDVLDFRGVFDRLRALKDPVGAELDRLFSDFEGLIDVFNRAGAGAAEFAQLEELYGLERAKAIEDASSRFTRALEGLIADLNIGDSGLSLRHRQANAEVEYDALAARVRAGDTSAYDAFADMARQLLAIERELYGSQDEYFARFDEVRSLSQSAVDAQRRVIDAATKRDSPFGGNAQASNEPLISAIDRLGDRIVDGLVPHLDATNRNLGTLINTGQPVQNRGTRLAAQSNYF